jgi:dihydropteroate synthase
MRTFVVGIVNCSPDSFSGDGHAAAAGAVAHGQRLADEGADVLDVGGESTRPGANPVAEIEELRRVLPVVEALAARSGVAVSIDTSKAGVAAAALDAGASIVNDVRALLGDPRMAEVAASRGAWVVLMDNRLAPRPVPDPTRDNDGAGQAPDARAGGRAGSKPAGADGHTGRSGVTPVPQDPRGFAPRVPDDGRGGRIVAAVAEWLAARAGAAVAAGIARDRIVLDPGLGFGKTPRQSLALLRDLGAIRRHPALAGLPLVVGPSRKGFIGHVLGLPVEERLEGTLAAVALAVAGGADLVRVHDVRAAVRCARLADAVVRGAAGRAGLD